MISSNSSVSLALCLFASFFLPFTFLAISLSSSVSPLIFFISYFLFNFSSLFLSKVATFSDADAG